MQSCHRKSTITSPIGLENVGFTIEKHADNDMVSADKIEILVTVSGNNDFFYSWTVIA